MAKFIVTFGRKIIQKAAAQHFKFYAAAVKKENPQETITKSTINNEK